MQILISCMYVVEVIVCLLLAGVVMLQKPKDGGLAAMGGAMGESVFGAQTGNVLMKTTIVLGVIFLLNTLALSRLTSTVGQQSAMEHVTSEPAAQTEMPPAGAVPPSAAQ